MNINITQQLHGTCTELTERGQIGSQKGSMGYLSLTLDQKRRIRAERDARKSHGEATNIMAMAQWAKETLKLPQLPRKATMSRLLSAASLSASPSPLMKTRKRQSSGTNRNVERVLFSWITDCYNRRVSINGPLIRAKALQLQKEFDSGVDDSLHTHLTFSEGWFAAFKRGNSDVSLA